MQLDIRLPIGLMFTVLGLLLLGVSFFVVGQTSQSQSTRVNLWWGIVMLAFGIIMFLLGRRGTATARLAEESPEGQKIEEMEHREGLES
jgi:steroid 5-alpha reductase family enzyme